MIHFDVTKSGPGAPPSGLARVSRRLRDELAAAASDATWHARTGAYRFATAPAAGDWFLTSELFSPAERPGFSEFLDHRPCRLAAIYHDAIPLKHPHVTWPHSVARHPAYLKMLSRFDRIWAVSEASRTELLGFWRWAGVTRPPPIDVLSLGADFNHRPRVTAPPDASHAGSPRRLLCLGILEPRKNQQFLIEVCEELWAGGMEFELHLVGRVNPHFGAPIVARIRALRRRYGKRLQHHGSATDATLSALYSTAWATALPTLAEGCGLPLLESLWMGVPVICSDIAPLRENVGDGGCVVAPLNDRAAWKAALRNLLADPAAHGALAAAARSRPLPTWARAADILRRGLT